MAKLVFDNTGERIYETGVDHAVLYPMVDGAYPKGYVWNGITNVTESPSGAESNALYADNIKYLNLISAEDFGFTIEAYTYPDEFMACDGSIEVADGVIIGQQDRQSFGLAYRTVKGNDTKGNSYGNKLHIVYNATAAPSERAYDTINDSPDAITFSWEVSTTPTPITVGDYKPTASIVIDTTKADPAKVKQLEDKLYGTETGEATLPSIDEVITLMTAG